MATINSWEATASPPTCSATSLFISLLLAGIQRSNKFSLEEARTRVYPDDNLYDFIVIGAGSAGSVVANRLSENPGWKILLLESGREQPIESKIPSILTPLQATDINWDYKSQPQEGFCNGTSCSIPRGRVLGGSSVLNGMLYVRGNPVDYDNWAKQGNPGWSYKDLLPLFKKSEKNNNKEISSNSRYHGTNGYLNVEYLPYLDANAKIFLEALVEAGIPNNSDINGESQYGATILQTTTLNGERWSTNSAFLQSVKERKNLIIHTRAHVTKVLIDKDTKTANGVEYLDPNGIKRTARVSKEVVISGGTINSPQILLLSGIGPKQHLQEIGIEIIHDLPGVGRNYHDHPSGEGIYYHLECTSREPDSLLKIYQDYTEYNAHPVRQGPLGGLGTLQTSAFLRTKYQPADDPRPDLQYHFGSFIKKDEPADPSCNPNGDRIFSYFNEVVALPITLHPKSRGKVLLNSADPLDKPLIYQNMFSNEYDMKIMLEGSKLLSKLHETQTLKKYNITLNRNKMPGCENYDFGTNAYWECTFRTLTMTLFHPVGTCKMGPSNDPQAVVDSELQVYGIKNLRVVDASIIPEILSGNTNAPTIMIGEKASYLIRKKYLGSGAEYDITSSALHGRTINRNPFQWYKRPH